MKSIVVALGVVLMSSAAHAYTEEQARLCTSDAFRLCGAAIPDIERVTMCMRAQKANLSPECRSVFDQPGMVQSVSEKASSR